jgi:hypothetical protein
MEMLFRPTGPLCMVSQTLSQPHAVACTTTTGPPDTQQYRRPLSYRCTLPAPDNALPISCPVAADVLGSGDVVLMYWIGTDNAALTLLTTSVYCCRCPAQVPDDPVHCPAEGAEEKRGGDTQGTAGGNQLVVQSRDTQGTAGGNQLVVQSRDT